MTLRPPVAAAVVAVFVTGCAGPLRLPTPSFVSAPDVSEVESVVYLVGDTGEAPYGASPVLARLEEDIAWWSERLEGERPVVALFLGDIVYPLGMHAPGTPEHPADSLMVLGQVEVLSTPPALEAASGYFTSGNHDWGLEEDWDGFARIQTLSDFLDRTSQATGASVRFVPDPGTGGPFVLDVGGRLRIIVIDTAWWILDGGRLGMDQRDEVLGGVRRAMETAGDREVVIAGHHPFQSAGPHGGEFNFWKTLGVRYLLVRSGAMLQDLTSIPYREMEAGLRSIFEDTEPPLLFAGGHEHSLQLFAAVQPTDPEFSIVSGAASKLSSIGSRPGMQFGSSTPGYMRLVVERDGGVTLFVESTPADYLACPVEEPARSPCMTAGLEAFATVHSQRLR
jgi:hypothetical protein